MSLLFVILNRPQHCISLQARIEACPKLDLQLQQPDYRAKLVTDFEIERFDTLHVFPTVLRDIETKFLREKCHKESLFTSIDIG